MNNTVIWKGMIIMLLVILILLGSINLVWYLLKYLPYKQMSNKLKYNGDSEMPRYIFQDEKYMYKIRMPRYLSFAGGFLYISPVIQGHIEDSASFYQDEDGNLFERNIPHVDMFIYPKIFSETEYGVTLYEETESCFLMTDKDGVYLPDQTLSDKENEKIQNLYNKHKDEISDILNAAKSMWGTQL